MAVEPRDAFTHAHQAPDIIALDARRTVTIHGTGGPEEGSFQQSIAALFAVAFTLKFHRRARGRSDFKVGPVEGDWTLTAQAADQPFNEVPRSDWRWHLRITVPSDVSDVDVERAILGARARRGVTPESAAMMRKVVLEMLPAGRYGRILHVGPYIDEPETFEKLETLLRRSKLVRHPGHIEVYLSDPQRTPPEKLKTALLVRLD